MFLRAVMILMASVFLKLNKAVLKKSMDGDRGPSGAVVVFGFRGATVPPPSKRLKTLDLPL